MFWCAWWTTAWQVPATAATASALPSEMTRDTTVSAQATAAAAPVAALATVFTLCLSPVPSVPPRPSVDASAWTSSGTVRTRTDSALSDASTYLLVGSPETGVYVSSPGVHTSLLLAASARGHELVSIGPLGAMDGWCWCWSLLSPIKQFDSLQHNGDLKRRRVPRKIGRGEKGIRLICDAVRGHIVAGRKGHVA